MILLITILVLILADVSWSSAVVILAVACVAEAGEIVVLRRWARRLNRRHPPRDAAGELVGRVATVVTACRPNGQVRVRGELWEATCAAGADAGTAVRVQGVEGLTLVVAPEPATSEAPIHGPPASPP
jgi:membrane protein implicated in regulation of membrane protease activity